MRSAEVFLSDIQPDCLSQAGHFFTLAPPILACLWPALKNPKILLACDPPQECPARISIKAENFIAESSGDVHGRIYQCTKSKTPPSLTFFVINKRAYFEVSTEIILKSILYPLT